MTAEERALTIGAVLQPSTRTRTRARARKSDARSRVGLTLVETTALLSLCGVIAAAFIPTFCRQLRFSKLAEASERLDSMYRASAAYYAAPQRMPSGTQRGCLPESAGPTPATPSADPVACDFAAQETVGRDTWLALGQNDAPKLRYSYRVIVAEPGCGPRATPTYPAVVFRALGDLDGDGVPSTVERSAAISTDLQTLVPLIPLRIVDRVE